MNDSISLLIVNYDTPKILVNFLTSIEKNIKQKENLEVIIIDNGYPYKGDSREEILPLKFSFKIQFIQNPRTSYASAINLGASLAKSDLLIAANSDIEIPPQFSFGPLINKFKQGKKIGVIGPQLIYPDGSWQRSYGPFPSLSELIFSMILVDALNRAISKHLFAQSLLSNNEKDVDYVDGAFMGISRKCFDECNGFDENYQLYCEDADFCWRAKQLGWKVIFSPKISLVHIRGASSTKQSLIDYTMRQFKAKVKFVNEHYGAKHARYYKNLIKVTAFQRFLFYLFTSSLVPSTKFLTKRNQAKMRYVAARNITKV